MTHEDHPTRLFEVTAQPNQGPQETHTLIYTDGTIAVTLYDCCYAMWHLSTGWLMHGTLWTKGDYLAPESGKAIKAHCEKVAA